MSNDHIPRSVRVDIAPHATGGHSVKIDGAEIGHLTVPGFDVRYVAPGDIRVTVTYAAHEVAISEGASE